ncbi:monovalent cation/H+ antiporter complex subunit F [Mycetocola sp.]|jgi:multicomponent Na+:H+ antiporter subunit F|uniref:monovalent cation/H+ antiporter complex subunit F n=1 Tax=Mycetocola sp. TaxID=1871042 RepID=UPI002605A905|nr:monovalent cation/H+ antiporter complex subunit F [Mycetocola sp.]MCU1559410.1 sodium:proton antiporter [Mycetocola sp.]
MQIAMIVAGVFFCAGAVAALYRVIRGPSLLDRVIASDVFVVTIMCVLATEMAFSSHTETLPVLLVLGAFAFVGSVSFARFMAKQDQT